MSMAISTEKAEVNHQQPVFGYRNIEILKGEANSLGIGSYGAVYKARCDDLPCAAKILHPTLFQSNDPGARRLLQRFEQECSFMNQIRHPNVVLFLGVWKDPQSGLPVLLMELLEENLTTFLERSQEPLPFHIQVNLCYDVALALSYLHSNSIIHHDLSSNNVLMVTGHRIAKVADFGISKLIASSGISKRLSMISLTHCPGTEVYMPPEAFRGSPEYTDKLDCFSFGPLVIQIITHLFPEPGDRTKVEAFPSSPTGTTEVPILETERRQSHIKLIDPDHPLLSIAFSCISYKPEERPPAQEICHQIIAIRDSPQYVESKRKLQLSLGTPPAGECSRKHTNINFPHKISATNLETTRRCRKAIHWARKYGRNVSTSYTLNFLTLDKYPTQFKQMLCDHFVDKETQQLLERDHTLNWIRCKSTATLVPMCTPCDGNSLCHAASLAMCGLDDSTLHLRKEISSANSSVQQRFKSTYMYKYEVESKEINSQCNEEWSRLVKITSDKAAPGDELGNLEEFHIFTLAHHLQRPIIVYANCNDTNLRNINYHGIYIPVQTAVRYCTKNPLPLAYHEGHFSALLCTDLAQQKQNGYVCLPICDYYGRMFPVKYALDSEDPESLLRNHLNIVAVPVTNKSPYFTTDKVTCAKLVFESVPESVKALLSEFIDTCYIEYVREHQ